MLVAPSTAQDPGQRLLRAALAGLDAADGGPAVRGAAGDHQPAAAAAPGAQPAARAGLVDWLSYSRTMPQRVARHLPRRPRHDGARARRGVPVLAVPHVGDMAENAARLDWSGAGLRLPWRLLSPATLRLAVDAGALRSSDVRPRARRAGVVVGRCTTARRAPPSWSSSWRAAPIRA